MKSRLINTQKDLVQTFSGQKWLVQIISRNGGPNPSKNMNDHKDVRKEKLGVHQNQQIDLNEDGRGSVSRNF